MTSKQKARCARAFARFTIRNQKENESQKDYEEYRIRKEVEYKSLSKTLGI